MASIRFLFLFSLLISNLASAGNNCQPEVIIEKELLITNNSVIDDPSTVGKGALSFATVFKKFSQSSSDVAAQKALLHWLGEWDKDHIGIQTPSVSRSTESLKWIWPKDDVGNLDLNSAPFVLTAVVYRPDLVLSNESGDSDGEMRFVFNLINPKTLMPLQFTAIFEFPLYKSLNANWAKAFHHLGKMSWDRQMVDEIQRLTEKLVPLHARLRINDFFLAFVWDLREFQINENGNIELQPLPMTPDLKWGEVGLSQDLLEWVKWHDGDLAPVFQTAHAFVPTEGFTWLKNMGLDESVRHRFALKTCNGCHGGETMTRFTHITPRPSGGLSQISGFLKGDLEIRKSVLRAKLCKDVNALALFSKSREGLVH